MDKLRIGFLGAGGIARSHIFAINSLRYFYADPPDIELVAVTSAREESRSVFAKNYGFKSFVGEGEFFKNPDINTVFILGPNDVHYAHLKSALEMPGVRRVYVEKPVCSSHHEEKMIQISFSPFPYNSHKIISACGIEKSRSHLKQRSIAEVKERR